MVWWDILEVEVEDVVVVEVGRCSASEALEDVGQQIEVGDHQGENAVAKQAMYST